jgi:lipopolysaccharide transport system permease protein
VITYDRSKGLEGPIRDIFTHWQMLVRLVPRDVHARYLGSTFGILWSFASSLLILLAYWFFLGVVLQARWGSAPSVQYPVILFSGLILHQFFAEVIGRAPSLIIANSSYVRKVVFPVQVLPWVTVATAAFHLIVNLLILLLGQLLILHHVPMTWLWLPVVILPLVPMTVGISWFVSSLGVYLRDMAHIVPLVLTAMMFLTPIFYSMDMVPKHFRPWLMANPLTVVMEQARRVAIQGLQPDLGLLGIYTLVGLMVMAGGYWWFARTKKGFADVL